MKRRAKCIWDYYTNFELAGVSSLIIAAGDMIWLIKESFGLPWPFYYLIGAFLVSGAALAVVSIRRHHEKHWKLHKRSCKK